MRTVLVNLPNRNKVVRRYMCSYNSPNFIFPPLELMYLAAIVEQKKDPVLLIDAIAENLNTKNVTEDIKNFNADLIVFMTGFEIFQEDIEKIEKIKKETSAKIICFGHYPTIFPKKVLEKTNIDFILLGEPELTFSELYDGLKENKNLRNVKGLAYKINKKIYFNKPRERIKNLDELPFPARDLLRTDNYSELLLNKPFTVIQTSRGCPFNCSYCVHTFGRELVLRSAENVLDEIEECLKAGVRSIKFIDDTFNVDKKRIIEICKGILDRRLKFSWNCLSRVDTLDKETLIWMKKAGCVRVYIGVESGSQKILDFYNKGYKAEEIENKVKMVHDAGIETIGFFMVGALNETEEDFKKSLELAKKINFDYVIVSRLIPYPGTLLFGKIRDKVDFSLFPYKNEFDNKDSILWEKKFYREFYFRPKYMVKKLKNFIFKPITALKNFKSLVGFIFGSEDKTREDYF